MTTPNPGINNSAQYAANLGQMTSGQARHAAHTGLAIDGALFIGAAHWLGNRKRKAAGMPAEPLSKWTALGLGGLMGYIFWWAPFAIYMLLDVYIFQPLHLAPHNAIGIVPAIATVALCVFLWKLHKKHHNRKYAAYYAAKHPQMYRPIPKQPGHAFGSEEWYQDVGSRLRGRHG